MVNVKKIILILVFCFFGFLELSPEGNCAQIVRVAVFKDLSKASLEADAAFSVRIVADNTPVIRRGKGDLLIKGSKNGFDIYGKKINAGEIEISRDDSGPISVNGRLFRGTLRFINNEKGFLVVNYVDLEDYIRGVLYHEISHLWPFETIKAQAIVVRTFALLKIDENKDKGFDLTNDAYSQVYGGRTSERFRLNKAIDETKGEILTFEGKILPSYYHATCAGETEDASIIWQVDIAPLKGVTCPYCKNSPHYKWGTYLELKELEKKIRLAGFSVGEIKAIDITRRSKTNRVLELKIISDKAVLLISGKDFRQAVGPNILRSSNFKVEVKNDLAFFDGFGWGHGVGLCQWGAYFMGKGGSSYKEILGFYYPGAKVENY